jgi:hypothetical protein
MINPYWYTGKVLRVVDGDTVDLMVDLGFSVHHKIRVRLYGINTPESRTKDLAEKAMGLKAKEFTKDWLHNHETVFITDVSSRNFTHRAISTHRLRHASTRTSLALDMPVNTSVSATKRGLNSKQSNEKII